MKSILDTIGKTPLIKMQSLSKELNCEFFVKLESFNPGSSVKDRLAKALIEDAEDKGILTAGKTIVEPSSGNTGIGIAMVAAMKGHKAIITMPETMTIERRKLIQAYGAEIILTPGEKGMKGAIQKANELIESDSSYIGLGQFENEANWKAHYNTTGPEIYNELGEIDYLIAGVGTGGTISGAGKFLKERRPNTKVVAVEPKDSPVLSGGAPGPHKIQGIGAGFIPNTLLKDVLDDIVTISYEEAREASSELATKEGIFCGVSSGAAIASAKKYIETNGIENKKVVVILPDSGERYLSTY